MSKPLPPDQAQRLLALDPNRCILVQAPAGSGKTDLLTRRFLRLLGEVEQPGQIVAITFTIAAAAEMRHRILAELEKAAGSPAPGGADEFSMEVLAYRALARSEALGWRLLDLPAQLRISTIDAFCRDLALQQPLFSGLGGGLDIAPQPDELYVRAARRTLERIDEAGTPVAEAIEQLLLWRDNNWQEMETLLVEMLKSRDRWMHGFVLSREPEWDALRARLERPFVQAAGEGLARIATLLDQAPGAREEALALARFACTQAPQAVAEELAHLAELTEFPCPPLPDETDCDTALHAHLALAKLLLTNEGGLRKSIDKNLGFPTTHPQQKARLKGLIATLGAVPGFEGALAAVRELPPVRYADEDWEIVRACFGLLRQAAAELQIVFAESASVDFVEVAQIAQRVLLDEDGLPSEAAFDVAGGIRHLLVDEFQDTSRRQHQLLARLIAAWPDRAGRTGFVVGDPMQSIYSFRDADAELFPRVRDNGLEIPSAGPDAEGPLKFGLAKLQANFRTAPELVERLNEIFKLVFAEDDGSGVTFTKALAAREAAATPGGGEPRFELHLEFQPTSTQRGASADDRDERENTRAAQVSQIVGLIQSHADCMEEAKATGGKHRIAVLGRAKSHLTPIAAALRAAGIPFRSVELEDLSTRPEVLDALALARALLCSEDRVAWLGVLRAPWCGLSLADMYALAGGSGLDARPVPALLVERRTLLSDEGQARAARVMEAVSAAPGLRAALPTAAMGTWLEQVWLRLGGPACVDAAARANLDLLWSCLDRLPNGEQDLLGPGLAAALAGLTALPDPDASTECGVQLMTIHKSKGLEFELVIVPELQAKVGRSETKMLQWLERGLPRQDESGEITEFLIAPVQAKGAEGGQAQQWVKRVCDERESQEKRRILYVAATRAREQLHVFARPAYKEKDGSRTLNSPQEGSLLATAWPALKTEIEERFNAWNDAAAAAGSHTDQQIDSIAAQAANNVITMPAPTQPTVLRRLPAGFQPWASTGAMQAAAEAVLRGVGEAQGQLYARHEGGLLSRALGRAVHSLFEELARLRTRLEWAPAIEALRRGLPRIAAQVRAAGIDPAQAASLAIQALQQTLQAAGEPLGAWILSPHTGADSEVSWAGVVDGALRTVRVDRVFQAGPAPLSEGEECWWIIDYKTAHPEGADPDEALPRLRPLFAPQIEVYGQVLRNLHGDGARVFAGLYYPRMVRLDWWEL